MSYAIKVEEVGWVYVIFAGEKPANVLRDKRSGEWIKLALRLRGLGFDALVFPGRIPDYVPLPIEYYV